MSGRDDAHAVRAAGPTAPRRSAGFTIRLAWWLSRGQAGRIWLLIACIAIGIAARVCVGSVSGMLDRALAREARPLLGADVEARSNTPFDDQHRRDVEEAAPHGARIIPQVGMVTMAAALGASSGEAGGTSVGGRSRTIELRAVSPGYPLYGVTRIDTGSGHELDGVRGLFDDVPVAYVQRELLSALGIAIGDRLKIGRVEFTIGGALAEDPGMGTNPFALGPRVLIAADRLEATGLTAKGSRALWSLLVATTDPEDGEAAARELRARWKLAERSPTGLGGRAETSSGMLVRTARQAQESVSRVFDRLGSFLRLVSLTALLLGGVGVASMVRAFVAERLDAVATLQVLGASPGRVSLVFLIQALGVGLCGGVLGAAAGCAIQNALSYLLIPYLPVALGYGVDFAAVAWGVALGALTAGAFALMPLVEIRRLSPLAVMRGDGVPRGGWLAGIAVTAVVLGLFAVVAGLEARSWVIGPSFIAALAAGGLTLMACARVLLPLIARLRLPLLGFGVRHGLGNLSRAGFRPGSAVVAIGLSALLFGSMMIHQASLTHEFDPGGQTDLPSLFAIDLQRDQVDDFRAMLKSEAGVDHCAMSPLVHGRYRGLNGAPPKPQERGKGFRDREQNLSWREELGPDEKIIAGTWMSNDPKHVEASLHEWFAREIGAKIGDTIAFDIQNVPVEATVTSIRSVHFLGMKPNFMILLSPCALVDAPQTWVAAIPPLSPELRSRVQAAIAASFPNVIAFDISEAGARIRMIVDRASVAVRFMGWFCLIAGLVVLLGIGLSTARERQLDAALLKVLGGRNRTLASSLACEFGALGLVGAGLGLGMALLFGWILVDKLLDIRLVVPWGWIGALLVGIVVLSALAGLAACRRVFTARPLAVLRDA